MNKLQAWIELRKKSVIAHWLYGLLCGIVAGLYFPAGIVLLVVFAGLEWWNDYCEGKKEGCTDFWDALCVFTGTFTIIVILHLIGVIKIIWN
jgi:hypothetical protein